MGRMNKTVKQFKCDYCNKVFHGDPTQEILVYLGGNNDCSHNLKVIIQTESSYQYSYKESTLCLCCQKTLLEKASNKISELCVGLNNRREDV